MEEWVQHFLSDRHIVFALVTLGLSIVALGKSADWLVELATELSKVLGIPSVIVGATIVSLGTTTPETAVSVLAAVNGQPELALGNAVGSIICDTGLILGLATLLGTVPIQRSIVNRQGWVQLGSAALLVIACIPIFHLNQVFEKGSTLPQFWGWVFIALLILYLIWSVRMAKGLKNENTPGAASEVEPESEPKKHGVAVLIGLILVAVAIVVVSAQILIGAATVTAKRAGVPPEVIAATLIAFGTSLPELVVSVTSVLRGRGDLALGNVIGADILNVLFVAGAAASVTPEGLSAGPIFFMVQFPAMIAILLLLRVVLIAGGDRHMPRWGGALLLGAYLVYSVLVFYVGREERSEDVQTDPLRNALVPAERFDNQPPTVTL